MSFIVEVIPEITKEKMIQTRAWTKECPVSLDKLRLVRVDHYNFDGIVDQGQLIVHESKAEDALNIFKELFAIKFPIHQIKLIDEYNGSDELSMADNNSSCFNFRKIAGTDRFSIHSYGLAIDINPMQNPMITINKNSLISEVQPKEGTNYLNRTIQKKGMVESIVHIFKENGFTVWGGEWNDPIDYHHFQAGRAPAEAIRDGS